MQGELSWRFNALTMPLSQGYSRAVRVGSHIHVSGVRMILVLLQRSLPIELLRTPKTHLKPIY